MPLSGNHDQLSFPSVSTPPSVDLVRCPTTETSLEHTPSFAGNAISLTTDTPQVMHIYLRDCHLVLRDTIVSRSHGPKGWGTWVCRATMHANSDSGGKNVILKCICPSETRTSEVELIKEATEKATGNSFWVRDHLPHLLCQFDAAPHQLGISDLCGEEEEHRVSVAVFEELFPITDLTNAEDLGKAFHDIFRCYRWLYEIAGILHRDISLSNLMFRVIDGKVNGVLNDFDLALATSASAHRIGTPVFMARELLAAARPPPHVYRFDLESLLYAMTFTIYHYHESQEIPDPPYKYWEQCDALQLWDAKRTFFTRRLANPTQNFMSLKPVVDHLHELFQDHQTYEDGDAWLQELLRNHGRGGEPDFDMVEKVFQDHLAFTKL